MSWGILYILVDLNGGPKYMLSDNIIFLWGDAGNVQAKLVNLCHPLLQAHGVVFSNFNYCLGFLLMCAMVFK